MGFTTPCFIRKSTYKLRKKLDELGYRLFGAELNEDLCIFTSPECGLYNIEFFNNIPHPDETDSVDCGTNEEAGQVRAQSGWTDIFIYPGYRFKAVDHLITNFHLPESTLMMLISAFAGRELVMDVYRQAIGAEYRFFSFGDSCLFL